MDEIRGTPARRLSQILDPITRLASDFGSNSAPCSPRLGARAHDASSGAAGTVAAAVAVTAAGQPSGSSTVAGAPLGIGSDGGHPSSSSRAGPSGGVAVGPDSPRLWPRQFRQPPAPPPRPRHVGVATATATTIITTAITGPTSTSTANNINNNNNNNNNVAVSVGGGGGGECDGSSLIVHARDSPYVNVPNLFFQRDKSFAESARSAGYVELRDKPKCSPYDFTSESSGHVEYADKRTFVQQSDLTVSAGCYGEAKDPAGLCRGRSNFEPGPSGGRGHFDKTFSFSGRQPEQPAPRMYETGRLFVEQRPAAAGSVDVKREKLDVRPAYGSSKSFDGYTTTVEELHWQERCLELQLELHRSRSQATRVRDMLREKVSAFAPHSFSYPSSRVKCER